MPMPRCPRQPLVAGRAAAPPTVPIRRTTAAIIAGLIAALLGSPPVAALTDDENQPLYIESDAAELDDLQSLSFYIGNVDVQQGSMQIRADEIVVHHRPDRQIDKIIAIGTPVRYRQLLDDDPVPVEGEALRAEWDAARAELTLIDQAILIQGGDRFASDRIVYNRTTARVTAGGSARGRERVKIRIEPEGADGPAGGPPAAASPPAPAGPAATTPRTRTMVEPVAPTAAAATTPATARPPAPTATPAPTPPATLTAIRAPVPSALPSAGIGATATPTDAGTAGPTLPASATRTGEPASAATPTPAPSPFLDPP